MTLFGITRSNNVGILLTHLKADQKTIKDAITSLNETFLTIDRLEALLIAIPTEDERNVIPFFSSFSLAHFFLSKRLCVVLRAIYPFLVRPNSFLWH